MRAASLIFLAFVIALAAASDRMEFKNWMAKHNKVYSSGTEAARRFQIFKDNKNKIQELNTQYPGVTFGTNKFADLTTEEFKALYLSSVPMVPNPEWPVADIPEDQVKDIPTSFDWRDKGAVTDVKDQGQCGSCWSFSTTGNVEGQWFLAGNTLVGLSEQNLVDCDHVCSDGSCDSGCDGGLMSNAFQYIIKNGGIDSEESYPYEGVDDTCRFKANNVAAQISNWTMIKSDEGVMAAYLAANGPVSVAVDAEAWQFYIEGVFYLPCGTSLDHGVLLVGYGTETDIFFEQMDYWIIKNSWGEDWGENGYIRIERGDGKCGVDLFPCSSIITKSA